MTILVTGATGYIGREFVKSYCNVYNIITLVRESSDISKIEKLDCTVKKYSDFAEIEDIFKENNISGIIHFAANIIVEHKVNEIQDLINSNITYGTYLLEFCKQYSVKWFINTGTFWQNYNSENYNPVNLYASTKEALIDIGKYYTQTSNLVFTTIKLNDTFGPNDTRAKIFNLWDKYSKSGETLSMSKGEQIIDISYIKDILNAFETMIENLQDSGIKTYNNKNYVVSSNQRMTLKELASLFEKVTQRKLNINWGSRPYRDREVMIPYELGETVPNWEQKYSLEKAIIETIGKN